MKYELSPSILSADFAKLGEDIKEIENAGIKWLHVDVMDGMFVPSISLGFPVIKSARKVSGMFFDVHLMIEEPIRYIKEAKESGADLVTVHLEACSDVMATIEKIREYGMKAAVAIKPGTPAESVEEYLPYVDMILVMTVEPGFGGQAYIDEMTEKIRKVRAMADEKQLAIDIQVDGGININDTIYRVLEAGANIAVAGSAVFKGDIAGNAIAFNKVMKAWE